MKLKTQLILGSGTSAIILTVLCIWVLSIYNTYEESNLNTDMSLHISESVLQLNSLTSDYLLYRQKRAQRQWFHTHKELDEFLSIKRSENISSRIDLEPFSSSNNKLIRLFTRIVAINQNTDTSSEAHAAQKKALASQLLTTTHIMSSHAKQLSKIINIERISIKKQLLWLSISIFIIFFTTMLVLWSSIAYTIVKPIRVLKNHIDHIHADNLNQRLLGVRKDEIGELAQSFNNMADQLQKTTVGKQKLIKEIEERNKTEKELFEQTDFNNTVLEAANNIIVILDTNGHIVKFNRAAQELSGYTSEDLIGKAIWDYVIPTEQRAGVENVFNHLKKNEIDIAMNYENHWLTKDGAYRLLEWHNNVLRNQTGDITHIVAIGHDITERKQEEKEFQRLQRELNQTRKMEALGQLTGGVAHDFNNILAIILGFTSLASDRYDKNAEPKLHEYLEQIKNASIRATFLVSQMLSFSRTEQTQSSAIQLAPLLDDNLKMLRSIIPSSIQIKLFKQHDLPNVVMDATNLQQVIMNLVINARDAMNDVGNITICLDWCHDMKSECTTCHQAITGDWIELSIKDDGCGMSKHIAERIFEPFFTTKAIGEGTGMGMSVLHGIVKMHNGHIILESTPGIGTSFRLFFPPVIDDKNQSKYQIGRSKPENKLGSGQHILIIDDQESLAEFQKELLESKGYQCSVQYNSEDALHMFLSNPARYDLIITDQTMPHMTGIELVKEIRKVSTELPVILTTGHSDKIQYDEIKALDILLMNKPASTAHILNSVHDKLKHRV
ncbi:MAG: PAS domain S-box protein [Gammaproteobacteria bacterium]|nr:PAS domain S-box protein [Gammaproteobacteria bacterium]